MKIESIIGLALFFSLPCSAQFDAPKLLYKAVNKSEWEEKDKYIKIDVDNDQDTDLLRIYGIEYFWLENINGKGQYSIPKYIGKFSSRRKHTVIDVDNDKDLDVVSYADSTIYWLENKDGVLTTEKSLLKFDFKLFNLFIVDINGDQQMDCLTFNREEKKLYWTTIDLASGLAKPTVLGE
ncbi:MAG: VCBS repeat-containing protein, partial [Bacteroidota bacterium]